LASVSEGNQANQVLSGPGVCGLVGFRKTPPKNSGGTRSLSTLTWFSLLFTSKRVMSKGIDENNEALSQLTIGEVTCHGLISTSSPSPSPTPEVWRHGISRSVSPTFSPTSSPSPSSSDQPPSLHPPASPNHAGRRPAGPEPTLATVSEDDKELTFAGKGIDGYAAGGDAESEATASDKGTESSGTLPREDEVEGASSQFPGESATTRVQVAPWPDIGSMSISGQSKAPIVSRFSEAKSSKAGLLRRRTQAGSVHDISVQLPASDESHKSEHGTVVMPWPKIVDVDYKCICSCGSGSFGEVYKAVCMPCHDFSD
jgi:hypothetical protein